MLTYDAVIFDLDGTLTDSRPGIFACTEYALKKMGLPVPPETTLRRFLGPPLAESYMKYCGKGLSIHHLCNAFDHRCGAQPSAG